ncbi:ATP-dependent RNA helicase [Dispira simplex]|nr:ATP-dependent RNA helicase [Dispira simplex]
MLNYHVRHYDEVRDQLLGLILTPTRELAVQVREHLQALAQYTQARVINIVGGMAIQKQRRLLKRSPNIIVATPGRLWELLSEDDVLASKVRAITFLAIDEADRMLERGHFAELTNILKSLDRRPESVEIIDYSTSELSTSSTLTPEPETNTPTRQTLVFSATLTTELRFSQHRPAKSKDGESASAPKVLQDLMDRIHFKEAKPCLVDVTQDKVTAAKLREVRIDCQKTEKDRYLYYLVTRYPARTLVFVNSIDALRRLVPVLQLLQVPAYGLHSQMEQRARLKNIDRFKANKHAVLIASDVAARGLDIPSVEHVVHYQIPTAADVYVHRSGRTARAQRDGISILLYCPEETKAYQKLCTVLKKSSIPEFPVDHRILREMKKRAQLARKINDEEHRMKKTKFESDWLRQQAQAMDIELDDDLLSDDDDGQKAQQEATVKAKVRQWKQELRILLEQPIVTRTKVGGGKLVTTDTIQELLASQSEPAEYNPHISMLKLSRAVTDFEQE